MGLFGGIKKIAGGAIGIATSPLEVGAKVVGGALETSGKVLTSAANLDIKGVGSAVAEGGSKIGGAVVGEFKDDFNNLGSIASGTKDFVGGGLSLIGTPVKGALRIATAPLRTGMKIAGTTLTTGGLFLGELAEGDVGGAFGAVGNGFKQQVGNVGGFFGDLGKGGKEIFGGPAKALWAPVAFLGGHAIRGAGTGLEHTGQALYHGTEKLAEGATGVWNGVHAYGEAQVNSYVDAGQSLYNGAQTAYNGLNQAGNYLDAQVMNGLGHVGNGVQQGALWTGRGLEVAGQGLQTAAG